MSDIIIDTDQERQEGKEFLKEQLNKRSQLPKEEKGYNTEFVLTDDHISIIKRRCFQDLVTSIKSIKEEAKVDLRMLNNELLTQEDFIQKQKEFIIALIQSEVKASILTCDIHQAVEEVVKKYVGSNLREMVDKIITKYVFAVNKKLKSELQITKELTYSIDAEIRHTLMEMPISYQSDKIIKDKIIETINNIEIKNSKLLEVDDE